MVRNISTLRKINPVAETTHGKYGQSKIVALTFPVDDYTKKEAEDLIKITQERFKHKNVTLMPTPCITRGFRNMQSFPIDTPDISIDLYGSESDVIHGLIIYMWQNAGKRGGLDLKNDCLFKAIVKAINKESLPVSWNTAEKFKKKLSLLRNDLIGIDKLHEIEEALKIKINVSGDVIYTSGKKYPKTANIRLYESHYSLINDRSNKLIKTICHKEQKIILYFNTKEEVICYAGNEIYTLDLTTFYENKRKIFGDESYVKCDKESTIIEEYNTYIKNIEHIKKESNGLINYYTCNGSHKKAVLKLLYNKTKFIGQDDEPEELTPQEDAWIYQCFSGGNCYGENIELENATCYDINSAYPAQMIKNNFRVPFKQGEFVKIESLGDVIPYGIYHVKIERSLNNKVNRLFGYFNNSNKYTHTDIYNARSLGLKVDLIVDGHEANALLYSADKCKIACTVFNDTIQILYELKNVKNCKFAGKMLSTLWGALAEREKITVYAYENEIEVSTDNRIIGIEKNHKGIIITHTKNGINFKHPWARFAPFLTASVRKRMVDIIHPIIDNVFRFYTDSFITDLPIDKLKCIKGFKLSEKIGDFKIEKTKDKTKFKKR